MPAPRGHPKYPGAGRPKGSANISTAQVRETIAKFAQDNVHRLQEWLEAVAAENPERAADLYLRALEYHIPKLARSEVTGEEGGPVRHEFIWRAPSKS